MKKLKPVLVIPKLLQEKIEKSRKQKMHWKYKTKMKNRFIMLNKSLIEKQRLLIITKKLNQKLPSLKSQ